MTLSYDPDAEERALRLLRSCLTPHQWRSLHRHGYFEIVGSHGGRYRIGVFRGFLINELVKGDKSQLWCLICSKSLPLADIWLAQKIALENDELGTLKIANPYGLVSPNARKLFFKRALKNSLIGAVIGGCGALALHNILKALVS